ncbi:MAG TPA: hypothetical protein VN372_05075 [Methanospirillum sp.]|nr:hypothetical protein [Methanospirillum sp.]
MNHLVSVSGAILLVLLLCSCAVLAEDGASRMTIKLKAYNASLPDQTSIFQERADDAVLKYTSSMPDGNNLMELRATTYDIAKKNVNPEFHPVAEDILKYLFYTVKGAEGMEAYNIQKGPGTTYLDERTEIYDQAHRDFVAANETWKLIQSRYPSLTKYDF